MRARRCTLLLAVALVAASATDAGAHEPHTSLAQLTHDPAHRELTASLRVYTDDFAATVVRLSRTPIRPGARRTTLFTRGNERRWLP